MFIDIEAEKRKYCSYVRIDKDIYSSMFFRLNNFDRSNRLAKRTRDIFGSFARVLRGRRHVPENQRDSEINNLVRIVRDDVLRPLLDRIKFNTITDFDAWHREKILTLKTKCHIAWPPNNKEMTVGMCQKIINLHCKDLWALNIVSKDYSQIFHPIIDNITLSGILRIQAVWTNIDNYIEYMEIQKLLREDAARKGHYPLAIECKNWNDESDRRQRK